MTLGARRATPARAATAVVAALLAGTVRLAGTRVLALAIDARLVLSALAAVSAATVSSALFARTIRFANPVADATVIALYTIHAGLIPLGLATVVVLLAHTTLDAGIVTSRSFARLAAVAGAGTFAAVVRTGGALLALLALVVAAFRRDHDTPAITASKQLHFVNAGRVPLHLATISVLVAYAGRYFSILARCGSVRFTTPFPTTFPAVLRACQAVFTTFTLGVPAAQSVAGAAPEVGDLSHTHIVPYRFTAEAVFLADTGLDARILATRRIVGSAAVALPRARTAVLRARRTALARHAFAVATRGPAHTIAASIALDFRGAGVVPIHFTAVRVLGAHAFLHNSILAAHGTVWLAAVPLPRAPAAIERTDGAVFVRTALAVAAIARPLAAARPTAKLLHFANADVVPLAVATEDVLFADTRRYPTIIAAGGTAGFTAVTPTGAVAAIVRARDAVLVLVTPAVGAVVHVAAITTFELDHLFHAYFVPGRFAAIRVLSAHAVRYVRIVAPWCEVGLAAGTLTVATILGTRAALLRRYAFTIATILPQAVAMAAAKLLHLGNADVVPEPERAAVVVVRAHALRYVQLFTTNALVGRAAVATAFAAVLRAVDTVLPRIAGHVSAIHHVRTAVSTSGIFHQVRAHLVPLHLATVRVQFAHTLCCGLYVAPRRSVGLAATTRAVAAVLRTGDAALRLDTLVVAAIGQGLHVAHPATELLHLLCAHLVPLCFTAKLVVAAHALGRRLIRTTGRAVGLAAVSVALTTIDRAVCTVLIFIATVVATIEARSAAITAAKLGYFRDAHFVPFSGTAVIVLAANARSYARIIASGSPVGCAAVPVAPAAVLGAVRAVLTLIATEIPAA